jgi:YD repeat-containing protein
MTYDPATDTLIRIDYPDGKYLEFQYNSVAQRTRSIDQSGFIVNYGYDTLGRLSQLTDSSDHLIVRYTYDAAGRPVEKTLGNDTYTQYEYDAAGRVISVANHGPRPGAGGDGPLNSHFDYTYDELGRVVRVDESDGRWDYTYDANGQVTHAVFTSNDPGVLPNQDLGYVYDAAGNRTRSVANGVVTLYTTNQLNEYTQVGSVTYTYDVDGNLRTKTDGGVTTTYTFDQENRHGWRTSR